MPEQENWSKRIRVQAVGMRHDGRCRERRKIWKKDGAALFPSILNSRIG